MAMNKKTSSILVIAVVSAVLSTAFGLSNTTASYATQQSKVPHETTNNSVEQIAANSHSPPFAANDKVDHTKVTELRIALRELWVDHVVWTRQYIVAAVTDAPDTNFAAERLLNNQDDIGDAIKPFYGDEAGEQLSSLLKDHILIAVDILDAAKAGDNAGLEESEEKWYDNADDIATFLSDANPNWPKEHMVSMLNDHLAITKTEAVARLTGDYETDVAAFDEIHRQAMVMADGLADGIVKQFPEQFEVHRSSAARQD
jgi:hypothetical protein